MPTGKSLNVIHKYPGPSRYSVAPTKECQYICKYSAESTNEDTNHVERRESGRSQVRSWDCYNTLPTSSGLHGVYTCEEQQSIYVISKSFADIATHIDR